MAFRISNEEIVEHHFHTGLSRILMEQVQEAESLFVAYSPKNHQKIIESTRDCVFKIHSVLQLLQPFAGEKFSEEEKGFRQLKIELSQEYEDSEIIRALTKLKYLSAETNSSSLLESVKRQYIEEKEARFHSLSQRKRFIDQALILLMSAQKPFKASVPEIYDIDMFVDVLSHSHAEVVRSYNNCVHFGGDDDFHHLYSAINVLRHQTEVLQNFSFAPTNIKRNFLERLSNKLDFYNDLTTLICRMDKWRDYLNDTEFEAFSQIAETQKEVLSRDLMQLGKKILNMNFTSLKQASTIH